MFEISLAKETHVTLHVKYFLKLSSLDENLYRSTAFRKSSYINRYEKLFLRFSNFCKLPDRQTDREKRVKEDSDINRRFLRMWIVTQNCQMSYRLALYSDLELKISV